MPIYEETTGANPDDIYGVNNIHPPVWGLSWGFAWGNSWGFVASRSPYPNTSGTIPDPIYEEN